MRTLLFLITALIIYGSLYPFDFSLASAQGSTWENFLSNWNSLGSLADGIGNILLFVPYGFISHTIVLRSNRNKLCLWTIMVLGLTVALGVQIFQVFLPTRDPALFDVWWNIIGITGGYWASRLMLPQFQFRWEASSVTGFAAFILCLWLAADLIPFVPSLDLQSFKDSVKPLFRNPEIRIERLIFHAASVLLAGRLLCVFVSKERNLTWLLALTSSIWFGKVLVVSTQLSLSFCAGTIAGFILWWLIRNKTERQQNTIILVVMLCTYCILSLEPFALRTTPGSFSWVPFSGLLEGSMQANVHGLVERMYIYTAILWLVHVNRGSILAAGIWLTLWVWLVEAAQTLIVSRSGSITEAIVVVLLTITMRRFAAATPLATKRNNEMPHYPSRAR